jgi:hypothetical protein
LLSKRSTKILFPADSVGHNRATDYVMLNRFRIV